MVRPSLALLLAVCLMSGPVWADLKPPVRNVQAVTDPSMVIEDRGSKLEVMPTKRAIPQTDTTGRKVMHKIVVTGATAPIQPHQLGVVFNHAMQAQGYTTGEIAFKMKAGHPASALDQSQYPGLKKIVEPDVYVVNARTPAEFISLVKQLQARTDLDWVEPTVIYGNGAPSSP